MGLSIKGFDELVYSYEELENLPDSMIDEMLVAGAEVVERASKETGKAYGVHRTGVTLEAIGHDAPRKVKDGRAIYIYPKGTTANGPNQTKRNAEVGYINEYGKKGQAPRPFMRDAAEKAADEVAAQEEKIYDEYLKNKGF